MSDSINEQVDLNYVAFSKLLPTLLPEKQGKYALMRDGKIVEFFDTVRDAYITGQKLFEMDLLFSIQEVVETPINLGYYSYAVA